MACWEDGSEVELGGPERPEVDRQRAAKKQQDFVKHQLKL